MREIQASDVLTRLPQLLDEVERGETVRITRHGRPVARIVPEPDQRREGVAAAVTRIKTMQKHAGRITVEDLLSAKHEGHDR